MRKKPQKRQEQQPDAKSILRRDAPEMSSEPGTSSSEKITSSSSVSTSSNERKVLVRDVAENKQETTAAETVAVTAAVSGAKNRTLAEREEYYDRTRRRIFEENSSNDSPQYSDTVSNNQQPPLPLPPPLLQWQLPTQPTQLSPPSNYFGWPAHQPLQFVPHAGLPTPFNRHVYDSPQFLPQLNYPFQIIPTIQHLPPHMQHRPQQQPPPPSPPHFYHPQQFQVYNFNNQQVPIYVPPSLNPNMPMIRPVQPHPAHIPYVPNTFAAVPAPEPYSNYSNDAQLQPFFPPLFYQLPFRPPSTSAAVPAPAQPPPVHRWLWNNQQQAASLQPAGSEHVSASLATRLAAMNLDKAQLRSSDIAVKTPPPPPPQPLPSLLQKSITSGDSGFGASYNNTSSSSTSSASVSPELQSQQIDYSLANYVNVLKDNAPNSCGQQRQWFQRQPQPQQQPQLDSPDSPLTKVFVKNFKMYLDGGQCTFQPQPQQSQIAPSESSIKTTAATTCSSSSDRQQHPSRHTSSTLSSEYLPVRRFGRASPAALNHYSRHSNYNPNQRFDMERFQYRGYNRGYNRGNYRMNCSGRRRIVIANSSSGGGGDENNNFKKLLPSKLSPNNNEKAKKATSSSSSSSPTPTLSSSSSKTTQSNSKQ